LKQVDILVPGSYFCDIIFSGLPNFPALGTEIYTRELTVVPGGVMNTVVGLHRLGVNVGWLGAIGNDFFSRFALEQAAQEGLDTSLLIQQHRSMQRVTVALSEPGDRAFVSYVDPTPDTAETLLDAWDNINCKHLHFTRLQVDERLIPLLQNCRERGISVSMDCQHRQETLELPVVQKILGLVDLFMPNSGEALRVTGEADLHAAAQTLLAYVPALVIKEGASGAHAWQNGEYLHAPALPDMQVIDTTGAGDVFNAGFLAARLQGQALVTCLRWGNIAGGLSTQGYGGWSSAPTLAQFASYESSS
jgi:sugar/nucleoside kinase (ribokinase family)